MRKQLPWYKEYSEDHLADGLSVFLTLAECEVFTRLKSAAAASPNRGTIQATPGKAYEPELLARRLRIKKSILTATINKLLNNKLITQDTTGIRITNWQEDQEGPKKPGKGSNESDDSDEDREPAPEHTSLMITWYCPRCGHEKDYPSQSEGIKYCAMCRAEGKSVPLE